MLILGSQHSCTLYQLHIIKYNLYLEKNLCKVCRRHDSVVHCLKSIAKSKAYDSHINLLTTHFSICRANQLTGFYIMGTLVVKRLNFFSRKLKLKQSSWCFAKCHLKCDCSKINMFEIYL